MNEISLYYDASKMKEIRDTISFEAIEAGTEVEKTIYVFNNIQYPIEILAGIESDNVSIKEYPKEIPVNSFKAIKLSLKSKQTMMKPITGKINIKLRYVIQ